VGVVAAESGALFEKVMENMADRADFQLRLHAQKGKGWVSDRILRRGLGRESMRRRIDAISEPIE
jgi:hypothetical protein